MERVIGTLRRECLDHVIVFHEASLYQHVKAFLEYYHETRTHLSLKKDPPESAVLRKNIVRPRPTLLTGPRWAVQDPCEAHAAVFSRPYS